MKLFTIDTKIFMAGEGALFNIISKIMLQKHYSNDKDNYCNLKMHCSLIDTYTGNKQHESFFSYSTFNGNAILESALRNTGYALNDINEVISIGITVMVVFTTIRAILHRIPLKIQSIDYQN